jgi:hypothetical protein
VAVGEEYRRWEVRSGPLGTDLGATGPVGGMVAAAVRRGEGRGMRESWIPDALLTLRAQHAVCVIITLVATATSLVLVASRVETVRGETDPWAVPEELSQTIDAENVGGDAPCLAAADGVVHLVWTKDDTLYYQRWVDGAWSQPNDILVMGTGGVVRTPRIVADSAGWLHLTWWGADTALGEGVYYSRAPARSAGDAAVWSTPYAIVTLPGNPFARPNALLAGEDGALHALVSYATGTDRIELAYVESVDEGASWSTPAILSSSPESYRPGNASLALGATGVRHAVWTELGEGMEQYGTRRIMFSQTSDSESNWTEPVPLSPRGNFDYASITEVGDGSVLVVWEGSSPDAGRWYSSSLDGGGTWSSPAAIAPWAGLTGSPQLTADSGGTIHMVVSANSDLKTADVLHYQWRGNAWSEGDHIAPGIAGEYPSAVTVLGNLLIVVWTAKGYDPPGLWWTSRSTGTPALQSVPVAEPVLQSPTSGVSTRDRIQRTELLTPARPLATRTVTVLSGAGLGATGLGWLPIAFGSVLAGVVVALVLLVRRRAGIS